MHSTLCIYYQVKYNKLQYITRKSITMSTKERVKSSDQLSQECSRRSARPRNRHRYLAQGLPGITTDRLVMSARDKEKEGKKERRKEERDERKIYSLPLQITGTVLSCGGRRQYTIQIGSRQYTTQDSMHNAQGREYFTIHRCTNYIHTSRTVHHPSIHLTGNRSIGLSPLTRQKRVG